MMRLTDVQAHVLANLERVEPWPRKINTPNKRARFQLDGKDCTMQITSLVVRKQIERLPSNALVRLSLRHASLAP